MNILSLLHARFQPSPVPALVAPPAAPAGLPTLGGVAAAARKDTYSPHVEIERICQMPIHKMMTPEEREAFCKETLLADAFAKGFRWMEHQAQAMADFRETFKRKIGGLYPLGVGRGKTASCLWIANHAYSNGVLKIVQFVPPHLVHQLVGRDVRNYRGWAPFGVPIHSLHGISAPQRKVLAGCGKSGLYIFPYSLLSGADATELLEAIGPSLIICDEAHLLANHSAARTKRLMRYVESRRPLGVCLSGTITAKSVKDYQHLCSWTLGQNSPLPLSRSMAEAWGSVIDAQATSGPGAPLWGANHSLMSPLIDWAHRHFHDSPTDTGTAAFRNAYRQRLTHTQGIVSSGDSTVGTSLTICNRPVEDHQSHADWPALKKLIEQVTQQWLTPNGDEIEHAIHTWKWLFELSAGFYNQLLWPSEERLAGLRMISPSEARSRLDRAKEHAATQQQYHRRLRKFFESNTDLTIDSPFKIGHEMRLHGQARVPADLYSIWRAMKGLEFADMPEREAVPVRVCDYKVAAACEWALGLPSGEGALIWCYNHEMANWISEGLASLGVPHENSPGDEMVENPDNADRIMVLTIKKYAEGKNLQHFQHQFVAQWPRQARIAEQFMGRCHRTGQKADELFVRTCNTLEFDHLNFSAALNDSLYIHQTTGVAQKMIYCNYDPDPELFPGAVLKERGLEAKILTPEQLDILARKFGKAP